MILKALPGRFPFFSSQVQVQEKECSDSGGRKFRFRSGSAGSGSVRWSVSGSIILDPACFLKSPASWSRAALELHPSKRQNGQQPNTTKMVDVCGIGPVRAPQLPPCAVKLCVAKVAQGHANQVSESTASHISIASLYHATEPHTSKRVQLK